MSGRTVLCFHGEPMTKREVLIARDAMERGLRTLLNRAVTDERTHVARIYPLPTVTRPRVVVDPTLRMAWKVDGDKIVWGWPDRDEWSPVYTSGAEATKELVAIWADLLANPTEDVEDET